MLLSLHPLYPYLTLNKTHAFRVRALVSLSPAHLLLHLLQVLQVTHPLFFEIRMASEVIDIVLWFGEVNILFLAITVVGFVTLSLLWLVAGKWRASKGQATDESRLDAGKLSFELATVVDWYQLGLNLGLPKHELTKIERDYQGNDRRRLEMLDKWLRCTPNATWRDVVSALEQMGENRVAESIPQKDKGGGK